MHRLPLVPSLVFLLCVSFAGFLLSLTTGVMSLPLADSLLSISDSLFHTDNSNLATHEKAVIIELRLPRTILALLVGCVLAQCGTVMQGLFRNPLADPGIIGVSSGAAVGAVLAIYFSSAAVTWWTVPVSAFLAGFVCCLFIYRLAKSKLGTSVLVLLLAGIAVSAFAGSLIGLVSYISNDARLRDLTLWQLGSLAAADSTRILIMLCLAAGLVLRFQLRASALNALLLGESEARHLGIDVEALKRELIILVALGVGLSVASSGIIAFVGLVVPHIMRTVSGPDHFSLLPLAGLGGGVLLLVADIISRLVVQPAELPVGIITALLGAPFFILLLLQFKGRE